MNSTPTNETVNMASTTFDMHVPYGANGTFLSPQSVFRIFHNSYSRNDAYKMNTPQYAISENIHEKEHIPSRFPSKYCDKNA